MENPWNDDPSLRQIVTAQSAVIDTFNETTGLVAQDIRELIGPVCAVFGSARKEVKVPRIYVEYHEVATKLGLMLAQAGWSHLNGCCPGIGEEFEKFHRRYRLSKRYQPIIAVRILLRDPDTGVADFEQTDHSRGEIFFANKGFGTRIAVMEALASGCVAFPGGIGTVLEYIKCLQMHQLSKYTGRRLPLILIGQEYWSPMQALFDNMVKWGTMAEGEIDVILTDSADEAFQVLQAHNGNAARAEWARQQGLAERGVIPLRSAG